MSAQKGINKIIKDIVLPVKKIVWNVKVLFNF
jgi:hypothetical protein